MIFLGPLNFPVTGQSHSFHISHEIFDGKKKKLCYPSKGSFFIIKTAWFFIKLMYVSLLNTSNFYLTISRSRGGFYRDFIIFILSRILKRRLIVHLHGSDFNRFVKAASGLDKCLINYMYSRIRYGIVLLNEMEDQFENFPNIKLFVLPNFHLVDIAFDDIIEKADNFRDTEVLRCLFLSNIINEKGIWETIQATERCLENEIPISLNIVGHIMGESDVILDNRNRLTDVMNRYSDINFLGPLYDHDKEEQLHQADIFILPTYYPTEALPIAALEAMAAGLILLITDHNYLGTVFNEKTGQLLETESSNSIYEALISIFNNKQHYREIMINNSLKAMSDFSLERYKDNFNEIILDSVGR